MKIVFVLLVFGLNTGILIAQDNQSLDRILQQIDKRMEEMLHYMDKRFEQMDKRFEQMDKQFTELLHYMDNRFNDLKWFIGLFSTVMGAFMGAIITLLVVILTRVLSLTPNSPALKQHPTTRRTDPNYISSAPDAIEG